MANPHKGEVTLQAGGETYRLRFTTNAMCELEDATGKTISEIVADLSDEKTPPGLRTMRVLLWAALIEHQEGTTVKDAGKICDEVGMASIGALIGKAIQQAFPDVDEDAGKTKASKA